MTSVFPDFEHQLEQTATRLNHEREMPPAPARPRQARRLIFVRPAAVLAAAAVVIAVAVSSATFLQSDASATVAIPSWRLGDLPDAAAHVSLLRNTGLQTVTAEELARTPILSIGDREIDARLVRRVPGRDLFVAPTRDGSKLCVAVAGNLGCATVEQLTTGSGALSAGNTLDGGWTASGLLADDAGPATAIYPDGTRQKLTTTDNVINEPLAGRPDTIRWTNANGQTQELKITKPLTLQDLTPDEQAKVRQDRQR